MVYCGRPSTGCGNCKSRRIKCDEARPHCQHCIKTNRDCPGYRAEVDLIFRKEEPGRRKRAKKSPPKTIEARSSARKRTHREIEQDVEADDEKTPKRQRRGTDAGIEGYKSIQWVYTNVRRANSVPDLAQQTRLSPSIEKQAKSFFLDNFVHPHESRPATSGFLQVAAPLVEKAKDGSALSLATEAVAIAAMAKTPNQEHLNQHAAHLYGRALAATQKAMQDPAHSTSDETLLAILLFALYESIVSSEHSTAAWTKHIEGAVAIVQARGVEQFENRLSLALFRAVRTQMLTNALHQRKPIEEFPGPKGWLSDMTGDDSVAFSLLDTSVATPNLLSRACSLLSGSESPDLRDQVEALLADAIDAQNSLPAREDYMPAGWAQEPFKSEIKTAENDKNEEATYGNHDLNVISIRNNMRVNQMLCSSVVIDALKWLDAEDYTKDARYETAKSNIQSLVDDICCSVPHHLSQKDTSGDASTKDRDVPVSDARSAQFLIWPLHTAMNMPCISELQRRWLKGRLLTFAKCQGRGILGQVTRKSSHDDRGKSPAAGSVQCTQAVWDSNRVVNALDHQLSPWLENQVHQPDDVKIDPALLMYDGCGGNQSFVSGGVDVWQEELEQSPLRKVPISVV